MHFDKILNKEEGLKMQIDELIKNVEEKYNVKIIFACESGSRAWGFPSPNSDYDIRFVYIRKEEDYLKLNKERDVIEYMLDDVIDMNGWDLDKALKLLHASNPTLFEWLNSPIIYYKRDFYNDLLKISNNYFDLKKELGHYISMCESTYSSDIKKQDNIKLKTYFYVIRPILAAKWCIEEKTIPPVLFDTLVKAKLDKELKPIIDNLLDLKKNSIESQYISPIKEINDYIEKELNYLKKIMINQKSTNHSFDELNELFLKGVKNYEKL